MMFSFDIIWRLIIPNVILAFLAAQIHCLEGFKSLDCDIIIPKSVSSESLKKTVNLLNYCSYDMHYYILYAALYIEKHLPVSRSFT